MDPETFHFEPSGRKRIVINGASDHWRHRLARLRRPLYSETEMGIIAMGWTVIATVAFILAFPC